MDVPSQRATPTSARAVQPIPREAVGSPRRRPTGAPPPLPYHLQTSGVGWLVAAVVLVALALAVFGRGMRGPAVAVTVADDAVVRWLGGLHAPGLEALWQGLAHLGAWPPLIVLQFGLLLALVVLRRWRREASTIATAFDGAQPYRARAWRRLPYVPVRPLLHLLARC
jgi:hypothetical protein